MCRGLSRGQRRGDGHEAVHGDAHDHHRLSGHGRAARTSPSTPSSEAFKPPPRPFRSPANASKLCGRSASRSRSIAVARSQSPRGAWSMCSPGRTRRHITAGGTEPGLCAAAHSLTLRGREPRRGPRRPRRQDRGRNPRARSPAQGGARRSLRRRRDRARVRLHSHQSRAVSVPPSRVTREVSAKSWAAASRTCWASCPTSRTQAIASAPRPLKATVSVGGAGRVPSQ